ncbi:TetR family transcriptional regulator [Methyloceanibacter marginalis]|uniref:TetR family transcriptional regulator n=1 Tax=Methyloceanibacter marginalis TaxID=1774971 RepID=UPI0009F203F2|nr:TetR family transcriptional regulator [Methyloceanibacter marginalis]
MPPAHDQPHHDPPRRIHPPQHPEAAVALFAERGYDGTSVRAIVTKARVNQAAINYHFKGKEGSTSKCSRSRSRAICGSTISAPRG